MELMLVVTDMPWIEDMAAHTPPSKTSVEGAQTVGAMLRQAREQLGLGLTEVATVTRIPRTMLEHLEQDLFDEYCAEVFARGHLLNYAREMRLDQEKVLSAYARQTGRARAQEAGQEPLIVAPQIAPAPKARVARAKRLASPARRPQPPAAKAAASKAASRASVGGLGALVELMRPRHMAGLVLILCALFAAVTLIHNNGATAQHVAKFPDAAKDAKDDWALERDVEKTRWLLEQPASLPPAQARP